MDYIDEFFNDQLTKEKLYLNPQIEFSASDVAVYSAL